jgi:hypothetical protein
MGLLEKASVAIDGSKSAVNNRDRNFTQAKVEKRRTQLEESVARYLSQLDTADRQEPSEAIELKKTHLKGKLWPGPRQRPPPDAEIDDAEVLLLSPWANGHAAGRARSDAAALAGFSIPSAGSHLCSCDAR